MVNWLSKFNTLTWFYFGIFKLIKCILYYILYFIYIIFKNILSLLYKIYLILIKKSIFFKNLTIIINNIITGFIFYFIKLLPWWIFNFLIKKYIPNFLIKIITIILGYLDKYTFTKSIVYILSIFLQFFKKIIIKIYLYIKDKLICGVFYIYSFCKDYKKKIISIFYFLINTVFIIFTIYVFIRFNLIIVVHNFFFGNLFNPITI